MSVQEQLIEQVIQYGNIFECFEFTLVGYQEIIDYLAKKCNDLTIEKLRVCYVALLKYYPSIYHYSFGKHLLTYFPKDEFIYTAYCICGGSPEHPSDKDEPVHTLWSLIFDYYTEILNNICSERVDKTMLLCNKIPIGMTNKNLISFINQDPDFLQNLFVYRCDNVIGKLSGCGFQSKQLKIHYIKTDWIDKYPSLFSYYSEYIHRCYQLKTEAPLYFSKISDLLQTQLSNLTLEEFETIDSSLIRLTCLCFPDQFTNVEVDEQFVKLKIYPLTVRAYILGLTCYPRLPQKDEIDQALILLNKLGIEQYAESVLRKDDLLEDQIANTEDTLYESPDLYHEMDRFNILENGKIYRFTRPEFEKLYQDKTNFWTKGKLTYSDIYSIGMRIQIVKNLNLPASDTILNLIDKASKGILFHSLKPIETISSEASVAPIQPDSQLLLSMFHYMLNHASVLPPPSQQEEDHE